MDVAINILCSVMVVLAVFLVIAVLMQSGKDSQLSGTIAGGAETFFGKTKGKTADRILAKLTTAVSIVFAVLVLVIYVLNGAKSNRLNSSSGSSSSSGQAATEETQTAEEQETEEIEQTVTEEQAATAEETQTAQ